MVLPAGQPRRDGARLIRLFLALLVAALLLCHGALAQQQWLPGADWDWTAPTEPHPGLLGEGWFTALGAGGQYGFVKPALDLVVVLRVDRDQRLPEPRFTDFAAFVELVTKAGGLDTVH